MSLRTLKPFFVEDSEFMRWLAKRLPVKNVHAITLGFIVFSAYKLPFKTKVHETIHFQQYLETLFIGFLILYGYDFLKGLWKYRDPQIAYRRIRAEQEAYAAKGSAYLFIRKRWQWIWKYSV